MSRLVNYGVGEICDRLSVLALKILHGTEAGKPVAHFETERAALVTQILARTTINGAWFEHAVTLGAVNGMLWRAEDDLRAMRQHPAADQLPKQLLCVALVAFQIQALNDQRAALVETINKLAGDFIGAEKTRA